MKASPNRRREDVPTWLWRLERSDYASVPSRNHHASREASQEGSGGSAQPGGDGDHALLIHESSGDRVLVLGDRIRRLSREGTEPSGPGLAGAGPRWEPEGGDEVAREVTGWRAERDLHRRRVAMAKDLLVLTERMHRCRKRDEVLDVLTEMAHQVLEASWSLVYAREAVPGGTDVPEAASAGLHARLHPDLHLAGPDLKALPDGALTSLRGPTVFTAATLDPGKEPELAGLGEVFTRLGAASMVVVSLGDEGLLVVLERRRRRAFDDEDRFFLRSIARSAEDRLARVYSPLREQAGR